MSITVDISIKFKGSKKELLKILADNFLISGGKKEYWFLNYIEFSLNPRGEELEYSVGHKFRPYNFVLRGTTYAWSSELGNVRDADSIIMDTLAQMLAIALKTRTMICARHWGMYRRYRHIRQMKRNKYCAIVDEKTRKKPKGFY